MEKEQTNTSEMQIQALLGRYLNLRSSNESPDGRAHLDEDSLTAFTEGNLSLREAEPIVSHLVDCTYCRHITAELVRLDLAFAEADTAPALASESAPSKVSEVLSGLLSRIFGTSDAAVFAHEDPKKDEEDEDKAEDEEKDK
jgi:hypothetical protein